MCSGNTIRQLEVRLLDLICVWVLGGSLKERSSTSLMPLKECGVRVDGLSRWAERGIKSRQKGLAVM